MTPTRERLWAFGEEYSAGGTLLSLDRWHIWKDGFAKVQTAEKDVFGPECINLAGKAVVLMDALEAFMKQ